jgi:hypothetical protein
MGDMNMYTLVRKMMVVATLPAAAACGGDDGPTGPSPADIAGIYDVCSLVFEPEGAQAPVDIRAVAMETDNPQVDGPELRLNTNRLLQFVYTPDGEFVEENIFGNFSVSGQQVGITFTTSGATVQPGALLLPVNFDLTFRASPRSLSTTGTAVYDVARADYARMAGVSESGLAERIPGRLSASFQANGCG